MLIQYLLLIIIVFILLQTARKFKARKISLREFLFWTIFWLMVFAVVLLPQITSFLAEKLGVGRGADLVVYASLIFVFYMIFRLFVRQEKVERDIGKIVEEIAKKDKDNS
ncbi:DUF2304 domain-containing protein [Candidatus Parcubacteria bacterium]|nr:DUF2304 domain-containing protein [Patescibacteria group bacterium]MCG2694439.1 DUF2304 domain-containing protein [Candidatus Parcubacteria bacterium]